MNSFDILQAKRALIELLNQQPDRQMAADEAVVRLREAGHRVNRDVLEVLVRGSANSPFSLTEQGAVRLSDRVE